MIKKYIKLHQNTILVDGFKPGVGLGMLLRYEKTTKRIPKMVNIPKLVGKSPSLVGKSTNFPWAMFKFAM